VDTVKLSATPDAIAPDGSEVRVLARTERGSMADFQLATGQTSVPVRHRSVEEVWFVLAGRGEMWRRRADEEAVIVLESGVSFSIMRGTSFQFRSTGPDRLEIVAVTMPPWPVDRDDEAEVVDGPWPPTVGTDRPTHRPRTG
jgi:mannose-6-phosphate isomerase-like protein (cupin superfamily)